MGTWLHLLTRTPPQDLLNAGGGIRGPRAELELSRKEVAALKKELEALQARMMDGGEARRVHAGELYNTREKLQVRVRAGVRGAWGVGGGKTTGGVRAT